MERVNALEEQANKLLGLRDSRHLLCVDGMLPSSAYQYLFNENPIDYCDSVIQDKTEVGYNRKLYDELWDIICTTVETIGTPLQKTCFKTFLEEGKQITIARKLGIGQPSVYRALFGVPENGYGGLVKKLRKHLLANERCNEILKELKQC